MKLRLVFFALATHTFVRAKDVSLFNGKDLTGWKEPLGTWSTVGEIFLDAAKPKAFATKPGSGIMLNTVDIVSATEHGDVQIHVEFNVSKGSNSSIYVQGRYEIQVFDSFGKDPIAVHDCGALYERWNPQRGKSNEGYEGHTPAVNASKPPGEWQSFDITFRAPRFDAFGKKIENAKFIKVLHNGKVIHENAAMTG